MTSIVDDFDAIARRMREIKGLPEPEEPVCPMCEGGGWIDYGLGAGNPHHMECTTCQNPKDLPSP